jgi:hypothetical protein
MFQPNLLISTLFALASAAIYFYVGYRLARRQVATPDARLAWNLFVVWWYGLAASTLLTGVMNLLGLLNITDLALFLTFSQINLLTVCAGLYGLMYYLIYLFTGKRKLLAPLTLFYIAYYALVAYYLNSLKPVGVTVGNWNTTLQYQQSLIGPFFTLILFLLVMPQIIGSFAYFTLFFRVEETTQKYRIALVSWSIIVWFGMSFLARLTGLSQQVWWQFFSRLLSLTAALTILMAYEPVRWIKQRFGVISISDQAAV